MFATCSKNIEPGFTEVSAHPRRRQRNQNSPVIGAIALIALLTAPAAAEIQTLFRGECFTPDEAAAKLDAFAATYNTADEWKARADSIRLGVRRGMRLERLPKPCELKPIRHSVRKGDGYTVENVAFESLPGFWVTGNLYLPEQIEGKAPGVLCPHGHLADNRLLEQTQTRCAMLARMGCVVFAYDMVGYGESTQIPHRYSETLRLQTYNSMRAVDFLLSLGNVDEARQAVTGESGGGTQTFILACLDDRIDLAVPVVMVSAHFYGGCMCESGMPIHKNSGHETNNVEITAAFAPKPLLLVSCGKDWTSGTPKVEFPHIQRIYDLCGAKANVENAHFANEGHDYGPSKRKAMYAFVAKHFKLTADDFDESKIIVHPREELRVFTSDHPRPDYAQTDAEQINAQLDRH
jgi:dienelactone hydrolase